MSDSMEVQNQMYLDLSSFTSQTFFENDIRTKMHRIRSMIIN